MYKGIFKKLTKDEFEAFLDKEDVKLFVGENYDLYRELWLQHFQKAKGERKKIEVTGRWNWLAFLYVPAWYGYRKMHVMFLTLVGILAAVIFYEAYTDTEIMRSSTGLYVVLALFSRSMYLQTLMGHIKKYENLPNEERKERYLKLHGGVSEILAWVYGIGFIVLVVLASVLGTVARGIF